MATYKGVKGWNIQTIAGDPSTPILGQVWYNSSSNVLKGYVTVAGAWAAGNPRSTGVQGAFGTGSQTAAITMGGNLLPGVLSYNCETYDGTSWTEVNNILARRYNGSAAGNSTAALIFGGTNNLPAPGTLSFTESWDGTCWTEVNNLLNGSGHQAENIGTQTAALSVGSSYVPKSKTVLYNGTSWTELNDLTGDREGTGGCGTSTAALICGNTSSTETWNGTSWCAANNITTGRSSPGSAMQASNTTALIFGGGTPASTDKTEEYDGTSWTEVGDLSGPITHNCGFGTGSAAMTVSGLNTGPPSITIATQEFNSPVYGIKTVTVS